MKASRHRAGVLTFAGVLGQEETGFTAADFAAASPRPLAEAVRSHSALPWPLGAFCPWVLSGLTLGLVAADGGGRAAGAGARSLAARGTAEQCVLKTPLRFIHPSQPLISLHGILF
eukprot:COSAG04_NODE_15403_length_533_cov_0.707373_1_plen_115_part_10